MTCAIELPAMAHQWRRRFAPLIAGALRIYPWRRGDEERFWYEGNWQSLCKACHDRKTGRGEYQHPLPVRFGCRRFCTTVGLTAR